jgi:hypothetical protein
MQRVTLSIPFPVFDAYESCFRIGILDSAALHQTSHQWMPTNQPFLILNSINNIHEVISGSIHGWAYLDMSTLETYQLRTQNEALFIS